MRKVLNKKGEGFLLGEQTVKIFVALLVILFVLVPLGAKLFGIFGRVNDERKAEAVLDDIELKIEFLQSSEYTLDEIDIIVKPITGWFLESYYIREDVPPEGECIGRFKSCLCMCNEVFCRELRVCKGIEENLMINSIHSIEDSTSVSETGYSSTTEYTHTLKFEDSIVELTITQETDKLSLKLK